MSVECLSAEEETGDADEIHQPSCQETSRHTKRQGDRQEEQSGPVELQVWDKLLAQDGEDGREDVQGKAVATKEDPSHPSLKGEKFIAPKQGGNGEIRNQNAVQACLVWLVRQAGQQGEDNDGEPRGQEERHEVHAALPEHGACQEVQS